MHLMSHKVLQYYLKLTSLVTKLATVLDFINEGSNYAFAIIALALVPVENAPDLVPGPGQERLSHIVCSLRMQEYPTFSLCLLIFLVFFTIELPFHSIFSSIITT